MKKTDSEYVKTYLPEISPDANKFTRGRLLLVAGSFGMAGAAIMSGKAALRTGVGYLNMAVPKSIYELAAAALPEAVFTVYDEKDMRKAAVVLLPAIEKADAVCMGCGLGTLRNSVVPLVAEHCSKKLLLDADALNAISEIMFGEKRNEAEKDSLKDRNGFPHRAADLVLTPHEGEIARLLGTDFQFVRDHREESLRNAIDRYGAAVLLKGRRTLIGRKSQDSFEIFENHTGNPGLARAGSGDVLSGIIGALMAQGMSGFEAAASGAFIHGYAGDLAGEKYGIRSMGPFDVIEMLPEVFKRIEKKEKG